MTRKLILPLAIVCAVVIFAILVFIRRDAISAMFQFPTASLTGHQWPNSGHAAYPSLFDEARKNYLAKEGPRNRGTSFQQMAFAMDGSVRIDGDQFTESEVLSILGTADETRPFKELDVTDYFYYYTRSSPRDGVVEVRIQHGELKSIGYNTASEAHHTYQVR
jgi:hypothetical protein